MNDEQEVELQRLTEIPILENELMWIARVLSEQSLDDVEDDESE